MCTAYLEGRSIAALARQHSVSRGAIRTAIADLMPDHTAIEQEDVLAPELPVTLDMPGTVADFLRAAELEPVERAALDHGVTVRSGQGYTLRVSAVPAVHRQLLARCQPLDGQFTGTGMRRYEQRITEAARTTAGRWDGYARTGQTLDIGQEMRRFALDCIWRSLTGHPLDDGTEHELAAVAAVATALPTLPADATDAQDAVAADLARIDAVAWHAIEAARSGAASPDGPGRRVSWGVR
ncbi:hypothetical protein ABT150_52755 [Streptomyces mirabilis]|uniref:hypothetical protein n=1 Tax=Streptomyces mirabilis TaxID=68239 RepID=UPI003331F3D0